MDCQQLLRHSLRWCERVAGHAAEACIFGNILDLLPGDWSHMEHAYSRKLELSAWAHLASTAGCETHGRNCSTMLSPDFDVSGLPCPDMSTAGKRQKRAGGTVPVYIAHGKYVTAQRTPLLLVECTKVARPCSCRLFCSAFGCSVVRPLKPRGPW